MFNYIQKEKNMENVKQLNISVDKGTGKGTEEKHSHHY